MSSVTRCHRSGRIASRRTLGAILILSLPIAAPAVGAQVTSVSDPAAIAQLRPFLAAHPELEARQAALEAARARARLVSFGPAAALEAEIEEVPGGINLLGAGSISVGVSREFVPAGTRRARATLAEVSVRRASLERELAERALLAEADMHLTRASAATAVARRLSAEDTLLAAAEDALRARFSVGDARYVDVLRLRSERLRVQGERASATADARVARTELLGIVVPGGAEPGRLAVDVAISAAAGAALGTGLAALPPADSLLALAAELRLAELDVAEAAARRSVSLAERRPGITGAIGAQRFDDGGGTRYGATVGASVPLPFTARRANAAAAIVAEREVDAARAEQRAALASARARIGAAVERYDAAREQIALYDSALLQAARAEREGALAAYRTGDFTLIELLDFERALARAEIDRLRSRMAAADALAALYVDVTGTTSHDEAASRREER